MPWIDLPFFSLHHRTETFIAISLVVATVLLVFLFTGKRRKIAPPPLPRQPLSSDDHRVHSQSELSGAVRDMPLHDLFQYLALSRRNGTLRISSGRRRGEVEFRMGIVTAARWRRAQGMEAVINLLDLDEGDYHFHPADPPTATVHGLEVVDCIMIWSQRRA